MDVSYATEITKQKLTRVAHQHYNSDIEYLHIAINTAIYMCAVSSVLLQNTNTSYTVYTTDRESQHVLSFKFESFEPHYNTLFIYN